MCPFSLNRAGNIAPVNAVVFSIDGQHTKLLIFILSGCRDDVFDGGERLILKLSFLRGLCELLRSLAGDQAQDCAQRMEHGDLVTVPYDKLFAITSCVAGVQELVVAAQRYITDLEAQLTTPLRRTED